jgi:tetratricopeptide (TPR) repeat protein
MDELIEEVVDLIRNRTPIDALNAIVAKAPEDIREKAKQIFDNPSVIETLDEKWSDLLALIYYAHLSQYSSQLTTRHGIAGQAVSSLTASKICRKLNVPQLEAIFLLSGAKALNLMGMKDRAEVCYLKAEEILRDLVKRDESYLRELSDVLNDLGIIYIEQNDREKGEKYLKEALKIRRKLAVDDESALPVLAQTLNNLASLYKDMRKYGEADEFFAEAEEIYRNLVKKNENYIVDLAVVLCNYAALCRIIREFEKAEAMYKEALEIFRKLTEKDPFYNSGVADVLMYLSGLYREMGRYEEAEKYMKEANKVFDQLVARMQGQTGISS